ncbi:cysteine synthase A [Sulfuriroseicoccus oceanibius]|uniref:cysteine synthase n=1 Tax=Sulfuriroseicoccus oceanibius TaxID=2707525 RepID=A0A6B3L3Y2_9BACT|nr:cysteine synthase A [Sulfuriroseicoccus oceanibius]QQL46193.1 cysteine synthase A [Sulfuriroseicoccus oceanibius]
MSATISNSLVDAIGNTPLIKLSQLPAADGAEVFLKMEARNPLNSVKDRIGKAMIETAEREGKLHSDSIIIEPTSGNTGIAIAFVARAKGYRCILVMPETMSIERRVLLHMLGAELVLTPGPKGMGGAIAKAKALAEEYGEKAFVPSQFDNPANPQVHRETTAEEIWEATGGDIDVFIAGVGTGGTITGVSEVIKGRKELHTVAVEPKDSPVISGGAPGPHKIQGIGAGFIPGNLNTEILDEVFQVSNEDAFATAATLTATEGIPAGISTGATVYAALEIAKRPEFKGKKIVVIGASGTERYLSTPLAESAREFVSQIPTSEV